MILVSACLCGLNTRYDGGNNLNDKVLNLLKEGKAVLICPEQLGGLSTPRPAREIKGGAGAEVLDGSARVVTSEGRDSTDEFIKGAMETLKVAKNIDAQYAILKAKSPSCGFGKIYDGTFSRTLTHGNGVAAELLLRNSIKVYTEDEIDNIDI